MSRNQKQQSVHSLTTPKDRILNAQKDFKLPPVIPGVEIVDFLSLDPAKLKQNICLLDHDPRVVGLDENHIECLMSDIKARSLNEPLVVITPRKGAAGTYSSLSHHRLEACSRLGWTEVPCFVVEIKEYTSNRPHTYQEILEDYTSSRTGCLNMPPDPMKPMTMDDNIRHLNMKHGFGEFGSLAGDELEKAVKKYAEAEWPSARPSIRGKIVAGFLLGRNPRKYTTYNAPSHRKYLELRKADFNVHDSVNNTTMVDCHTSALWATIGLWLKALTKVADGERALGKTQEDLKDLLENHKFHLRTWASDPSSVTAIHNARKKLLDELAALNTDNLAWPFMNVSEVSFAPQILEPRAQKENKEIVYSWNSATSSWDKEV